MTACEELVKGGGRGHGRQCCPSLLIYEQPLAIDYEIQNVVLLVCLIWKWFSEFVARLHDCSVKLLVRLLKDLRSRFWALQAISPWIIELLVRGSLFYFTHFSHHYPSPFSFTFCLS